MFQSTNQKRWCTKSCLNFWELCFYEGAVYHPKASIPKSELHGTRHPASSRKKLDGWYFFGAVHPWGGSSIACQWPKCEFWSALRTRNGQRKRCKKWQYGGFRSHGGTPKSSILIWVPIMYKPWKKKGGTPILGNPILDPGVEPGIRFTETRSLGITL